MGNIFTKAAEKVQNAQATLGDGIVNQDAGQIIEGSLGLVGSLPGTGVIGGAAKIGEVIAKIENDKVDKPQGFIPR